MKDYYYILGINKNASLEEVKKAYRKLSLKFHPDQNNGDKFFEERFRDINEAYETLNNEERRKEYDTLLKKRTSTGNAYNTNQYTQQQRANSKAPTTGKEKRYGFINFLFAVFIVGVVFFIIKRPGRKDSPVKQLTEDYKVLMDERKNDSTIKLVNEKTGSPVTETASQATTVFTRQLKTTMVRFCSFDTIANVWGKWTAEWSPMDIIHNLQQYDSSGLAFNVKFSFDNPAVYSRYSFAGYETANDWFKYIAPNGDMICIKGVQLSYLVNNGWPSFPIEIYYWSQRQRVALLLG